MRIDRPSFFFFSSHRNILIRTDEHSGNCSSSHPREHAKRRPFSLAKCSILTFTRTLYAYWMCLPVYSHCHLAYVSSFTSSCMYSTWRNWSLALKYAFLLQCVLRKHKGGQGRAHITQFPRHKPKHAHNYFTIGIASSVTSMWTMLYFNFLSHS
jgi:hypothetical protein